jgi:hypothetical protein
MVPMKRSRTEWLLLAVAVPPAVWVAFCVVWLAAAAVGLPGGFDGRSMTLSEATAISSYADAARLLRSGVDPNAPSRLRAGIIRNRESTMTPLEAATGAIRTGPVQMLVEHGAMIDARNYSVLWCGAVARRNNDMLRFLESRRLTQSTIDCATVRALW